MQQTKPQLIETAERRRFVLELRKQGINYRQIADAAVSKFGAAVLPAGWDERYAYKDVARALEQIRTETAESADSIRTLELERLDRLMVALWPRASRADEHAIDRILKIMQRRAQLVGLDAPATVRLETWQDEIVQLLRDGRIKPEDVTAEFPDLAGEFFARAGINAR